jgi:hypothetical protein
MNEPIDSPFRIRSHQALIQAAQRLRDELGAKGHIYAQCDFDERVDFQVSFYVEFWAADRSCRVSRNGVGNTTDPQIVFYEFEKAMRSRFAPEQPIPAGLEACDGASISEAD